MTTLIVSNSSVCVRACACVQTDCDPEKGLEMRKRVLSGILVTEETYLSHLEALLLVRTLTHTLTHTLMHPTSCDVSPRPPVPQPMKPLKAAATTSQPVLTSAQIDTIFYKVPELYEVHREFYDGLLPRVQQWSHHQRVGDLFQKLVRRSSAAPAAPAAGAEGWRPGWED